MYLRKPINRRARVTYRLHVGTKRSSDWAHSDFSHVTERDEMYAYKTHCDSHKHRGALLSSLPHNVQRQCQSEAELAEHGVWSSVAIH